MHTRIYINELRKAYSIEEQSLNDLSISYPVLKNMLNPISDKKVQVITGCEYSLESKEDLALFIRIHSSVKILVGGYLLLAEKAWRMETQDKRPYEDFYQTPEFQNFMSNGGFEKALNGRKIYMTGNDTVHGAIELIINHSKYIADQLFKPEIEKNILTVINSDDEEIIQGVKDNLEGSTANNNAFICCRIEGHEDVFIHLANTEQEQELFVEWLKDPMVDRRLKVDGGEPVFGFSSSKEFYEWLNYFRLKITSYFCYQTLVSEMKRLYGKDADVKINHLNNVVESFGGSLSPSSQKFERLINHCNDILMGENKKDFIFLSEDSRPITPDSNGNYIYSLYM